MIHCTLGFDDWRQEGNTKSIYGTELGVSLSSGDLHSGTCFRAGVKLTPEIEEELAEAWRNHQAYPIFRMVDTGAPEPDEPAPLPHERDPGVYYYWSCRFCRKAIPCHAAGEPCPARNEKEKS